MPRVLDGTQRRLLSSPDKEEEEVAADADVPAQCDDVSSTGAPGDGTACGVSNSAELAKSGIPDKIVEAGELCSDVGTASGSVALLADAPNLERVEVSCAAVVSAATEPEPSRTEADGCAPTSIESSEDINAGTDDKQPTAADSGQMPSGRDADSAEHVIGPASDVAGDKFYVVKKPLHLGLSLKLGSSYTAEDLRRRCRGDQKKLNALDKFLADPTALSEGEAKGSKACRGRPPKKIVSREDAPPIEKKAVPDSVPLHLARSAPKRRKVVDASEFSSKVLKGAALPLSHIGSKILATAIGDPSTPANPRPQSRKSDAFVAGQTVWHLEANRPPWPAQVVAVPTGKSSTYRVRPLGEDDTQQQIGEGVDVHPDNLLAFVGGDALALALVADQAEMLHERFVQGRAKDTKHCINAGLPTEPACENPAQLAERARPASCGDQNPGIACRSPMEEAESPL